MKVYIVYLLSYTGCQSFEILGIYNDYKMAEAEYLKNIKENIEEFDFDYDKECKDIIKGTKYRVSRLFRGGYQENWDNYLEIYIEEKKVI